MKRVDLENIISKYLYKDILDILEYHLDDGIDILRLYLKNLIKKGEENIEIALHCKGSARSIRKYLLPVKIRDTGDIEISLEDISKIECDFKRHIQLLNLI